MTTTEIAQAETDNGVDVRTAAKVIESLVLRGDLSALGPAERARFYVQMCNGLGLNPSSQPFAFLRLNGKEILYATRGATDQLAAIHKLTREIIDGPKVIDLAGTKAVYACARAKHPNGRVETSVATVPLVDPINALMKCETKAKRRVTLSILGLGLLDEMELETIPAAAQEPAGGVDFDQLQGVSMPEESATDETDATSAEIPDALVSLYARIEEIELPGEAVAVWLRYRAELAPLSSTDREAAWKALCRRTEEVGKMKNAKRWLKLCIAEEDARRADESAAQRRPTYPAPVASSPTMPVPADPMRAALADVSSEQPASLRSLAATASAEPTDDDATRAAGERATLRLALLEQVSRCKTPGAVADLWVASREERSTLTAADVEVVWKASIGRVKEHQRGDAAGAKSWLKKAVAERTPPDDGTNGPTKPRNGRSADATGNGAANDSAAADGAVACVRVPEWSQSADGLRRHLAAKTCVTMLRNSLAAHAAELTTDALTIYAQRYAALWATLPENVGSTLHIDSARAWVDGVLARAARDERRAA